MIVIDASLKFQIIAEIMTNNYMYQLYFYSFLQSVTTYSPSHLYSVENFYIALVLDR